MKSINVGLIGLGTVGSGVTEILLGKRPVLDEKLKRIPVLRAIADRSMGAKASGINFPADIELTTNPDDVVNNSEIDVVIEVVGGVDHALRIVRNALENGKDVVTANKELLAVHGSELIEKARSLGRCIAFEASVCGGVPIVATLMESLVANRMKSVYGIVNGTTNYILSKMTMENACYADVLAEAQKRGYAEKDPTKDVQGIDSAHKLAILAKLSYGLNFDLDRIYCEGIANIELEDICYARRLGYTLKLLAIARKGEKGLELRVHPALLPHGHPLTSVNGVYNGVYIMSDVVGEMMLYGPGAGSLPTASAIVADLVAVSMGRAKATFDNFNYFGVCADDIDLVEMADIQTRYYLHFLVANKPGVLEKISGIIGRNNISIASVIQQENGRDGGVPLIMLTHLAREGDMRSAIVEIKQLDVVKGDARFIRIEDTC